VDQAFFRTFSLIAEKEVNKKGCDIREHGSGGLEWINGPGGGTLFFFIKSLTG
jgi:hypothetical protein